MGELQKKETERYLSHNSHKAGMVFLKGYLKKKPTKELDTWPDLSKATAVFSYYWLYLSKGMIRAGNFLKGMERKSI